LGTSNLPPGAPTPTIPLTPDAQTAYEKLYDAAQTAIENTTDGDLLESLNDSRLAIADVLTADNMYRLNQNTVTAKALVDKINMANDSLKALAASVAAIASKIKAFGDLVAGINKVLALVSAF
jgi:hypothetical protein